jgi:hypothetical protein
VRALRRPDAGNGCRPQGCSALLTARRDGSTTVATSRWFTHPRLRTIDRVRLGFKPNAELRAKILERLASADDASDDTDAKARRRGFEQRLARLRDLYELGDIPRAEYLGKREAIQAELAQLVPAPPADLSLAERVRSDFRLFWEHEPDHEVRLALLQQIFDCVWLDSGGITAVQPKAAFAPFFTARDEVCKERERRDSNPRPPA